MARIRSIKPEVRISEKVNSWPMECRYFWVLLWGYCDDYGYGRDNARLIVADSFPLDDAITAETVESWMDLLWRDEVIERFMVGDSQYFRVVNWEEHQKISHPAKQVLPTIEQASEVLQRITETLPKVTEPSEKTSPKQGAGSREKEQGAGSRGTPPLAVIFETFWHIWPRKEGKADALKAFEKASRKVDPLVIVEAANEYVEHPHRPAKQFVPHATTWLNGERWDDGPPTAPEAERPTAAQRNLSTVEHFARQQQSEISA